MAGNTSHRTLIYATMRCHTLFGTFQSVSTQPRGGDVLRIVTVSKSEVILLKTSHVIERNSLRRGHTRFHIENSLFSQFFKNDDIANIPEPNEILRLYNHCMPRQVPEW